MISNERISHTKRIRWIHLYEKALYPFIILRSFSNKQTVPTVKGEMFLNDIWNEWINIYRLDINICRLRWSAVVRHFPASTWRFPPSAFWVPCRRKRWKSLAAAVNNPAVVETRCSRCYSQNIRNSFCPLAAAKSSSCFRFFYRAKFLRGDLAASFYQSRRGKYFHHALRRAPEQKSLGSVP